MLTYKNRAGFFVKNHCESPKFLALTADENSNTMLTIIHRYLNKIFSLASPSQSNDFPPTRTRREGSSRNIYQNICIP